MVPTKKALQPLQFIQPLDFFGDHPDHWEAISQVNASYLDATNPREVDFYPHGTRSGTLNRSVVTQAVDKNAVVSGR